MTDLNVPGQPALGELVSQRWLPLAGVWCLYAAFGLNIASLAPLVSVIESDLSIRHAQMGTILGAWQLVYIGAAIPCGILLDRIGGRSALVLGGILMAASAMARSYADDYWNLLSLWVCLGWADRLFQSVRRRSSVLGFAVASAA